MQVRKLTKRKVFFLAVYRYPASVEKNMKRNKKILMFSFRGSLADSNKENDHETFQVLVSVICK